ncbi:hypothetical protein V6N11_002205 [Hibiscus sabdariffa]|uniref:Uncharacterized protein n=1 Tax=Hibiscus sabdariffa TaxID=183260 RepID=A0ABR2QUX5_9ROSI
MVRVEEKGFSDQIAQISVGIGKCSKKMSEKIYDKSVSLSESTSESSLRASPAIEASVQGEEEDSFKTVPQKSGVNEDGIIEEVVDQVVGLRWVAVIEEMFDATSEPCGLEGATTRAGTYSPFHSEDLEVAPKQPVGSKLREGSNENKILIRGPEGDVIWYSTSCPIHSEDLDVISPKQPIGSKVGEESGTNNGKFDEIIDQPRVNLKRKTIESDNKPLLQVDDVRKFWVNDKFVFSMLESVGSSGGLLLIWTLRWLKTSQPASLVSVAE